MADGPGTHILLVDDDEIDVIALTRAFAEVGIDVPLIIARDGEEALGALLERGLDAVLMLLDLNMPRMGGFELLERRASDPRLGAAAVLVMTTSSRRQDIERAHALGIVGYVVKATRPGFSRDFAELVRRYLALASLPRAGGRTR
ncbi:MAG TPA: response regulator [Geminicoccaceae bacterium]|jgi:CheY-like chemotaxis protein|nr:response regulator [Geminicoccaceae bacterium]HRY23049.1 response regulator [Geminicoccaceae bacterium]